MKPTHSNNSQFSKVTEQTQLPKQKATWQKPRIQRLLISLDTAQASGMGVDARGRSLP